MDFNKTKKQANIMIYELNTLSYQISSNRILKNLNCKIKKESLTVLIGPNGAGKSSLIKILSGEVSNYTGDIKFYGRSLKNFSCTELASVRAVLTQNQNNALPFKSYEIVNIGKIKNKSSDDLSSAISYMNHTESSHLALRNYNSLSGGEVKRVDLAKMLAQDCKIFLLDEPTNHLDPYFQRAILVKCKELIAKGFSVVAALHDLNLASIFADEIIAIKDGVIISQGHPNEIINKTLIKEVFQIDSEIILHPSGRPNILML